MVFSLVCLIFISCQKSSVEPTKRNNIFSSATNRVAIAKGLKSYFEQNNTMSRGSSNGAKFIVPIVSGEGVGIGNFDFTNFTLELANFSTELSSNDFYRENPDGTISVHVNSNNALAEYYKNLFDPTAMYLFGNNAHFDVNYTGMLVEIPIYDEENNLLFVIKFIDFGESGRAVSMHGNGKVGAEGVAPWKNLSLKIVSTPSGQGQVEYSLK